MSAAEKVNPFRKATRSQLYARVAFDGPTGSGKTWTALEWAEVLANREGTRIALIDTESGSASYYSDRFDFDVLEWAPPYDPNRLADHVRAAVDDHGYGVVVIDSLTHFWTGEGGTLDIVDNAGRSQFQGNRFAGWQVGTPAQRNMVETLLRVRGHVITTMRSRMEYAVVEDANGKKSVQKLGLAPEQRAGIEYEFTLVVDMDLTHTGTISKSRCHDLADATLYPSRAGEAARVFVDWLKAGEELADVEVVEAFTARLNALPEHLRAEAKWGWVNEFGRPDQFRARDVERAEAFVCMWEARDVEDPDDDEDAAETPATLALVEDDDSDGAA